MIILYHFIIIIDYGNYTYAKIYFLEGETFLLNFQGSRAIPFCMMNTSNHKLPKNYFFNIFRLGNKFFAAEL